MNWREIKHKKRKKEMAKKRQREKELIQSYESYVDENTSAHVMGEQANEDLFIVDRIGSKTSRRKLKHQEKQQEKLQIISKVERKLIEKQIEKLQHNQDQKNETKEDMLVDLWADSMEPIKVKSSKKKKGHALKLPIPGVSYNPSHLDHQDAIAEV